MSRKSAHGMADTVTSPFVVNFLSDSDDESKQSAIENFFREHNDVVIDYKVDGSLGHRTTAHRVRRQMEELLYESLIAELRFTLTLRRNLTMDALHDVYAEWCQNPPIDAWVGRGTDTPLFGNELQRLPRSAEKLDSIYFGVVDALVNFCCDISIRHNNVIITAKFHHVHSSLNITVSHTHACKALENKTETFLLEIKYSSIARAIVDFSGHSADIYLRLTSPVLLYKYEKENDPRSLYRVASLGCNRDNCSLRTFTLRHIGSSSVVKLTFVKRTERSVYTLLTRFFSKLPRGESFVAKMSGSIVKRSSIKEVRLALTNGLFKRIEFRAAYAIDACRLISLDLIRQLGRLSQKERSEFMDYLEHSAKKDVRLFEKAMFHIAEAVDQGRVIIYTEAVKKMIKKYENAQHHSKRTRIEQIEGESPPPGLRVVYKVYVTPARTILRPPAEHGDNRILREHGQTAPDMMLRVAFRDDNLCSLTQAACGSQGEDFLNHTVRIFLAQGLTLVGRTYHYLAASSSQLREHGCWMYATDDQGRTAADIRRSMGDFGDIKTVGKRMAREGQCLSSTTGTVKVLDSEYTVEEDIKGGMHEISKKPYVFSDGIGKISKDLRDDVCRELEPVLKGKIPCAFQIRYRGAKGMIALDPSLEGRQLVLRESMVKFKCNAPDLLEVIKWSEERNVTLNRQLITILEQLGVNKRIFLHYQERNILDFTDSLLFESSAAARLHAYVRTEKDGGVMMNFHEFRNNHMSLVRDPYFRSMLLTLYNSVITDLKSKSRIAIPWTKGRNMLGVLDETGTLEYGQIYVQYTVREDVSGENWQFATHDPNSAGLLQETGDLTLKDECEVLTGPVVVTKCPCLHPGDVRMFTAVDVPKLSHLKDVIVFPAKGPRPHPNEMAGSDLDGDEYVVIWDPDFKFQCPCSACRQRRSEKNDGDGNHPAMIFDDQPPETKDNISLDDYFSFFIDYIMNDQVGRLSNAHLAQADQIPDGIFSDVCLDLAKKTSRALDFGKTGRKGNLEREDHVHRYPDFMEKQDHKRTYRSKRVLGDLYRSCRMLQTSLDITSMGQKDRYINEFFCLPNWEQMRQPAGRLVQLYNGRLRKIMEQCGVSTEAELMAGLVTHFTKYQSKSFHEVEEKKEELAKQRIFLADRMKKDFDAYAESSAIEKSSAKLLLASACYMVVYAPQVDDPKTDFYGLPWLFAPLLMECMKITRKQKPEFAYMPAPCSPFAAKISEVISDLSSGSGKVHEDVLIALCHWALAEELLCEDGSDQVKPQMCYGCLKRLYEECLRTPMFAENKDDELGSNVLLFIRYCAMDFKSKTESIFRSDPANCCAMTRGDVSIFERITRAAMKTYSKLAVTGDIGSIAGLCAVNQDNTLDRISVQREGSPKVLCVRDFHNIRIFEEYARDIATIFKQWCGAKEEDKLTVLCNDPRGRKQVSVVLFARELAHYQLDERLDQYEEENDLMNDIFRDAQKLGIVIPRHFRHQFR